MRIVLLLILSLNLFAQNSERITTEDYGLVGTKNDTDLKGMQFEKGDDTRAYLRANFVDATFEQSFDNGVTFDPMGGGGGGASGINALLNPGFEQGRDKYWTYSAGTVTETVDPTVVLNGKKSVNFDAAAQNDFLSSVSKSLPVALFDNICTASIIYKGGDENLSLRVLDDNNLVLGNLPLIAKTKATIASFEFNCPTQADVTGDPNKGKLRLELYQDTAVNAATIEVDDTFLGIPGNNGEPASSDNLLKNGKVEKGLIGFAGIGTLESAAPLRDLKSINFDPTNINDFAETELVLTQSGMDGQNCMGQFLIGPTDGNLSASAINADGLTVTTQVIAASTTNQTITLQFRCPISTATVNERTMKVRIFQTTATNAAAVNLDSFWLGLFSADKIQVVEGSQWYYYTANADINGNFPFPAPTASTNDGTLFTYAGTTLTVRKPSILSFDILGVMAASNNPSILLNCTLSGVNRNYINDANSAGSIATLPSTNIIMSAGDTCSVVLTRSASSYARYSVNITATPMSSLASVVSSIPDNLSARISSTGVVTSENYSSFITGNCTLNSAGDYTCPIGIYLENIPACSIQVEDNSNTAKEFNVYAISTTSVSYRLFSDANALASYNHNLKCSKQGDAYGNALFGVLPPQLQNSTQQEVWSDFAIINNNGTASIGTPLLTNLFFIASVSRTALGTVRINFPTGKWPSNYACLATPESGSEVQYANKTATTLDILIKNSAGTALDSNFSLSCGGIK